VTTVSPATRSRQLRRYVETRHIDRIPDAARRGKPWHQLAFWFGGNTNVFNIVLGAVAVATGLTFWWALAAITIGTAAGALLIALHATQGPRLGVPQTIQSRAQLGFWGASFLFPAVLLLNIGFIAAELVIQAQAMTGMSAALPMPAWIIVLTIPSVVIGVFGYGWIHKVMQVTAVTVGISLIVMLIQGLGHALPAAETTTAAPHVGLFAAGIALFTIDMLSFGPFTSDYTRYLPAATNGRRLFWAIYAGSVTATVFSAAIGAYLAALLPSLDPVTAIGHVSGKWALLVLAFSLVNANTFNAYTGAFQVLSLAGMWHRFRPESVTARLIPFLAVMAAGAATAVLGYARFVTNLTNFLDVILVLFIPWSAVNLCDYFWVRRGNYDVPSFFDPAGGAYGKLAWRGLAAYLLGLAIEWPFVSQPDYTGPLVAHLGGADISWLVGWLVTAAAYLLLTRTATSTQSRHASARGTWLGPLRAEGCRLCAEGQRSARFAIREEVNPPQQAGRASCPECGTQPG
jgi:nucleobase:cation symporter-1, NCS1 family